MKKPMALSAALLAAALLLSACGQAAPAVTAPAPAAPAAVSAAPEPVKAPAKDGEAETKDKEETVYAKADASGKVRSVTVEAILNYSGEGGIIRDKSQLRDIRNTQGDEEFESAAGGVLRWEDHGEPIRYEGKSGKDLPIRVKLSYFLDGKPITPEKLAGKSGRLRLRFDYENLSRERVTLRQDGRETERETCIPFLAVSVVMLPEEVFSHTKANEGRLVRLGEQSVFVGYALPGLAENLELAGYKLTEELELPDYAELEADVENFSLDFTATIVTNGLLTELEEDDLQKLDDLSGDTQELIDAIAALSKGSGSLSSGAEKFQKALEEYTQGVQGLDEGAQALSQGLAQFNAQFQTAREALKALLASLSGSTVPDPSTVTEALDALLSYLDALQGQVDSLRAYPAQVSAAVSGARGSLGGLSGQVSQVLSGSALSAEEQQQILAAVNGSVQGAQSALDAIENVPSSDFSAVTDQLSASLQSLRSQVTALRASPEQLASLDELIAQLSQILDALDEMAQGAAALAEGSAALREGGDALAEAGKGLADGSKALSRGLGAFSDASIPELRDLGGAKLRELVGALRAMRQADLRYDNFSGIDEGRSGSVRFIIETDAIE